MCQQERITADNVEQAVTETIVAIVSDGDEEDQTVANIEVISNVLEEAAALLEMGEISVDENVSMQLSMMKHRLYVTKIHSL